MAQPLAGIRVVDFGQYLAGPLTAMLLADEGADVIRIDPPGGPRWQSPANAALQRGKRSIVLDLTQPGDRETAVALVAEADVVVENFRPGVMDRLGLGAEAMTRANPGLVYCSLPGFAPDDPRAGLAAWEGVVGAAARAYSPTAAHPDRAVFSSVPSASSMAAFLGAGAITAALIARERDGLGQAVSMPLFDAMFALFHGSDFRRGVGDAIPHHKPGLGTYRCSDGRYIEFSPGNSRFLAWVADAFGLEHWHRDGLLDPDRLHNEPDTQIHADLEALFASRTALEWEAELERVGVTGALCRTVAEWRENEHARASGTIVTLDDPEHGAVTAPGRAVRVSPPDVPLRPRRPLGADQGANFGGVRFAANGSGDRAGIAPPPLAGIRVVDTSQILAAPTVGRILADFGAEVVKVNDPEQEIMGHADVNRGKRSLLLDLRRPESLEALHGISRDVDVFLQNFRMGAAARMGMGYDEIRALSPDVVYVSVSCYGYDGPWGTRRGYDNIAAGATGMMGRHSGDGAPERHQLTLNDYATGALGAYAALLGLFRRARTGVGGEVAAALAYSSTMLEVEAHTQTAGGTETPHTQEIMGTGPLQRLYQASDGWLFVGAAAEQRGVLAAAAGVPAGELDDAGFERALEARFARAGTAFWETRLAVHGIGAHQVASYEDIAADPRVLATGLLLDQRRADGVVIRTTGPVQQLSRTPLAPTRPASLPGHDLMEVLGEAGLEAIGGPLLASGAADIRSMSAAAH